MTCRLERDDLPPTSSHRNRRSSVMPSKPSIMRLDAGVITLNYRNALENRYVESMERHHQTLPLGKRHLQQNIAPLHVLNQTSVLSHDKDTLRSGNEYCHLPTHTDTDGCILQRESITTFQIGTCIKASCQSQCFARLPRAPYI